MKLKIFQKISLVLCAAIMCVALAVAVFVPTVAQAYKDTNFTGANKKIGEIYLDNAETGGTFSKTTLQELLVALGASGSTLDANITNLKTSVDNSKTTLGASGSTKDYNDTLVVSGKKIVVKFGGIDWIPVILSLSDTTLTNDSGTGGMSANFYNSTDRKKGNTPTTGQNQDVILTLWQATGFESATWSATGGGYGTSSVNTNGKTPANMYGTSMIRAVTLNNGGYYATAQDQAENALTLASQSELNTYAKFTMPQYKQEPGQSPAASSTTASKKSNISQFLVSPRYVAYQKNLNLPSDWNWTQKGHSHNNDAWGWKGSGEFYQTTTYWYEQKTNYNQWMDDLIWLPASAETGNYYSNQENKGIWLTDQATQRSSSDIAWLRTAA